VLVIAGVSSALSLIAAVGNGRRPVEPPLARGLADTEPAPIPTEPVPSA
jgi:hypothetical protein